MDSPGVIPISGHNRYREVAPRRDLVSSIAPVRVAAEPHGIEWLSRLQNVSIHAEHLRDHLSQDQ